MPPVRFCNHTTWGHDPIELSYPCETRAATHFSRHGGPPLRERRRTCRRRAFEMCHPAHVFPTGPTTTFADMNSRWIDACDTANSARPMPGERREGRRTKRRTRHRGRVRTERGHARLPSHGDGRRRFPSLAVSGHPGLWHDSHDATWSRSDARSKARRGSPSGAYPRRSTLSERAEVPSTTSSEDA
jgi:hypothetical protein